MNKYGYNTQINVVGIGNDDPYYGGIHPEKSKSEIVVSKAFASKYSLSEGEKFILSDNVSGTNYAFTIASVADYSADLSVFMNVDSMRELFGYEKDDYNVLISDRQLDIEAGRVYSITTYDDVVRSATIVADMMNTLISILIITAGFILVIVMYLLMNVMIDRARFGVSLVKVFGFRMNEIKRMYLTTHRIIIYVSIVIGLPLAKLITKELLPILFSTVSSGINTSLAWYYYAVVIAIIMVIHEIINMTLVRKINKVTPAEVLKRRD